MNNSTWIEAAPFLSNLKNLNLRYYLISAEIQNWIGYIFLLNFDLKQSHIYKTAIREKLLIHSDRAWEFKCRVNRLLSYFLLVFFFQDNHSIQQVVFYWGSS